MIRADWWVRVVQPRTQRNNLLPQPIWTVYKGEHAGLRATSRRLRVPTSSALPIRASNGPRR
jgi:hypothetical protein